MEKPEKMVRGNKKIKNQVVYLTSPPFFVNVKSDIIHSNDNKVSDSLLATKNSRG